jgi:signal transduction histidine kinase
MVDSIFSNLCADATPSFLRFFDLSIAPTLLYYAYIPVVLISLILGFFIFIKDKRSLVSKLFLGISILFSLWVINIIVQWVAVPTSLVHFSWQLTGILEVPIFLLSVYFVSVFTKQEDICFKSKLLLALFYLVVLLFTPTVHNISSFNLVDCQGNVGFLWKYIYALELFCVFWIGFIAIKSYKKLRSNPNDKNKIVMMTSGIMLFLLVFSASNIYGELFKNYEINLIGPLGMVLFIGFTAYIITAYKTFNSHVVSGQILVYALWSLIFSLMFISNITVIHYVVAVTFLLTIAFGILLIKSIKREVSQREHLQELSYQLEKSNLSLAEANDKLKGLDKLKTEFLSLASHQLRSPLTAIKGYASMLSEGAFGSLDSKQDEAVKRIYTSAQGLTNIVEDLLNVSKIEQGGMKYEFSPTSLSTIVTTLYNEMKVPAESKSLEFSLEMDSHDQYIVSADATKIKQVFLNLVDNSIKYTPKGFVKIFLKREGANIVFSVLDSGMGISPETRAKLFEKFSRGEGGKTNTGGSGLGLYLAQQIARAHKGDVTIESPGLGKGSTFIVTLPASGSYPN